MNKMISTYKIYALSATLLLLLLACTSDKQSGGQQVEGLKTISVSKLHEKLVSAEKLVLLDTRSTDEYASGHLENARFVNFQTFSLEDVEDIPKNTRIVIYCHSGGRSQRVGQQLVESGYKDVSNLEGGIVGWKANDLPVVQD
ncbi:MAG: rhodanese-like domain-containing protein [Cyclobacteriaceae bacterium]